MLLFLRRRKTRLPPGPRGWPIFGNMFQLGEMPHRTMAALRENHGPVVWLQMGAIKTMAILSAEAAAVFFKRHDHAFADRTITEIMRVHNYHNSSLALAPYGPYWRLMRRLVNADMLVAKRINDTAGVRRKCVGDMITWVAAEARKSEPGRGVHVARFVFLMTFNLFGNLMLSRDLFDPESEEGSEFFTAMMGLMEWTGHANVTDLFPWLGWLDPQGLRGKMDRDMGKAIAIASRFVKQRLEQHRGGNESRDFLDVLLDFQTNNTEQALNVSDKDLNIFILEIFLAGSETTSSSIEWALTELLCNRECLRKVKSELNRVVGREREVEESDIEKLPYLQGVVKETLRLHPPIPLLVPRKATEDTEFMGYYIPKDTQVLVNAWAIGRDPSAWDEPLAFNPQRFSDCKNNVDYKGHHFEFIPFGAGRRMCAGVPLAHRVLHLVLGSLLHRFDWELDCNVTPSTMDMTDKLGITMRKSQPLLAVPKFIPTK
uniref:Cytochrome P450 76A2 n=2 Tax=Cajanus cajan TaxID=3821 RepID=A0A151TVA9_CAJCA|nr:Cytochrome P450 76A2 [Cajanus cajan]